MSTSVDSFLGERLMSAAGQPLRVAVYSRLADGIRSGVFPLGAMLPRETELAGQLGISRTPVREALMLLEEDGLIRTKRGVGRFVTDSIPRSGLELFQPFDQALAQGARVEIRPREFGIQPTTDFISNKLALDSAANTWFRESIVHRDGDPVALVQEHLPAGKYLTDVSTAVANALEAAASRPATLLAGLIELCGPIFGGAVCQVTASIAGPSRGAHLGLSKNDPVLVLTQTAELDGTPIYLAKCIISSQFGHLSVIQSSAQPS
ncbi:GntR family transcriptional regulator [Plantibacter sp. YIM 135249]|uniref:GntR family transcriptional regulator n=1 Tax=Plantibacter sp. YIM 135249 TaxID=3423918 RepID=UPI003D34896C